MKRNNDDIPNSEELGVPSGSLDPIESLKSEFDFYDKTNRSHFPIVKIVSILFITISFVILPIIIIFFEVFLRPPENIDILFLSGVTLLFIDLFAGIKIISTIIKGKKRKK